jgi:hypothetical protein
VPLLKENGEEETLNFEASWRGDNHNPAIEKLLQWVD